MDPRPVLKAAPPDDEAGAADQNNRKAAACLVCRRSKIKCERGKNDDPDDDRCQRCLQLGAKCVRPAFHVGRRKGVKNKRTGLEKALHQVEEAVRKASGAESLEAVKTVANLKSLLGSSGGSDSSARSPVTGNKRRRSTVSTSARPPSDFQDGMSSDDDEGSATDREDPSPRQESTTPQSRAAEESLAVDDAENPLQLLARASDLHVSPQNADGPTPIEPSSHKARRASKADAKMAEVEKFFKLSQFGLDTGPELDPIDLGLLTEDEAESLFTFFQQNLAHTRWGLDPELYTVSFTRSRSAFLFTSIAAASALFLPAAAALSRRLCNHCKNLVKRIMAERYRSVEIVLAFMVNVPWMFPGKHSMEDDTCWYVSMATTMTIDLSLHKALVPLASLREGMFGNVSRADCIDPKIALSLDGFGDVDPASVHGRRLLRRRERCWIALFVLERGMCLARGRVFTVPITPTLQTCDKWHISDIADARDGHLVSTAVLRRDLDGLFSSIRAICDGSQATLTNGSAIANSIELMIEKFFDEWHDRWGVSIGIGQPHRLPPYVQILVTHTRLSLYSSVMNHPTAPTEVRHFFHSAGLSSALNVVRAAIQGESQLMSMPNNTAIMISFAACFALRLSGVIAGATSLAPSIRTLIEEAAEVLERIGRATDHRNGMSALYGKYLKYVVKKAATAAKNSSQPRPAATAARTTSDRNSMTPFLSASQISFSLTDPSMNQTHVTTFAEPSAPLWSEPIQFSTMSHDQIEEALSRVGNEFDPDNMYNAWDDPTTLDWMNWSNMPEFGGS